MSAAPDTETLEAVRQIVAERTNVALDRVGTHTRLATDLGVDGDDAHELLEAVAKRFPLNFDGFVFLDHFGWEGFDLITPLFVVIASLVSPRFRRLWRAAKGYEREITIHHLALCASASHWIPSTDRKLEVNHRFLFVAMHGVVYAMGAVFVAATLLLFFAATAIAMEASATVPRLLGALGMIACSGFAYLISRTTRAYLRSKEVWHRISPVAE